MNKKPMSRTLAGARILIRTEIFAAKKKLAPIKIHAVRRILARIKASVTEVTDPIACLLRSSSDSGLDLDCDKMQAVVLIR